MASHADYERIFAEVEAPFAFVDLDAMWDNAARDAGTGRREADPGREQVRPLPRPAGADPGRDERFRGLMTFTLPETLWLADHGFEDLLLAYPTTDRGALEELALRSVANPEQAADRDGRLPRPPRPDRVGAGRGRGADPRLHRARRELVDGSAGG